MSASSSSKQPQQPPPHLHLHVGTTSATATTATTTTTKAGSAASPGSASSSHASHPHPTAAGGGGGIGIGSGQINQACAACKYQRRKCARDCPLAPYFPADQHSRFLHVHRLFGVSNVQKTLRRIEPKYGPDAMRSIIYQSEARAADPVGGCVGIIEELRRQIRDTEMELQFVRQQIAIYRQAAATDALSSHPAAAAAMILPAASVGAGGPGQQDDMLAAVDAIYAAGQQPSIVPAGGGSGGLVFGSQQQDYHHVLKVQEEHNDPSSSSHQQQLYDYFCYNGTASGDEATSDDGGMQQYGFADVIVDGSAKVVAGSPEALGEQLGQHCRIDQSLPFVNAFNIKPQVLPATAAAAGDVLRPEHKKLAPPVLVEHDDVDEHMEEQPATAGAPCHLELGFSS